MNESKPKRRWCQFSLTTLLVVITVVCVGFAWIGVRLQRARENRARVAASEKETKTAVAAIEGFRGKVTSSYEELRPQTWLETQFDDPGGADDPVGVREVTVVNLFYCRVTDTDLEHLKGFKSLQKLDLSHTNITDAGLEHLKGLTNLRFLDLSETGVTTAGMEQLKGLKNLKGLTLFDTLIGDVGVKPLQQALPNCTIYYGSVAP